MVRATYRRWKRNKQGLKKVQRTSDGCNFTKFDQSFPAAVEEFLYDSNNCSICKGLKYTGNLSEVPWQSLLPINKLCNKLNLQSTFCEQGDIFVTRQNFAVPAYLLKFTVIA